MCFNPFISSKTLAIKCDITQLKLNISLRRIFLFIQKCFCGEFCDDIFFNLHNKLSEKSQHTGRTEKFALCEKPKT